MTKLRIFAKAQISLTRIRAKKNLTGAVFGAAALLFGLMAFGMLNFSALSALIPSVGTALGAMLVGLANLLVAFVLLMVTRKVSKEGGEEKMIREVSQMAMDEISKDVDKVKADLKRINDGIESIYTLANTAIIPVIKLAFGQNGHK